MVGIESIVLFSVLAYFVSAQDELYFSQNPADAVVVTGKSVTLTCEVTPNEGVVYYWELNGSKIDNTTRRFQKGSNLHITRVDRERDSGKFTCIAQDSMGLSITSSAASLNIQWIETASVQLQSPESESDINSGSEVILRCHLEASGDVHVEWFRNADRLVKTDHIDIKKRRLYIKSVSPLDNGIYRCTAQNEAGIQQSNKNFALAVPGDQTSLIQSVPNDQLVKKGGTASFHCSYQHAEVLEWYFKEQRLTSDKRINLHSNGTLQINMVQDSDQGLYTCVGIKSESTEVPQSFAADLKLSYIHNFSKSSFEPILPDDPMIIVGEKSFFQLTCLEPKSVPMAKKFWLKPNGHTISDAGDIRVDEDGRLIIEIVKFEDAGQYICVAENIAGRTEKLLDLVVTSKPSISTDPSSITVEENEMSLLACGVETKSPQYTSVRWRKSGKLIKQDIDSGNQRVKIFKQNGTLFINSTSATDRGEYICEVVTTGFEPIQSKPATISVIEILKFVPPPVSKKLELGSIGKVHCKAQGTPPPIMHWEKQGFGPDGLPNHITDMNGTLQFNGVLFEDKGKYICTASNSQGIINVTINIDVVVAPKFSILPKNPTESMEGQAVMIDCIVEGDPKPTIQWDKNSKLNDFDHSRFKVLQNGTLFINEVRREDENNYGCTAGSSAGLNRKEVRLIVHTREGYHPNDAEGDGSTVTKAVLITMSVAAAYIILVVGLMIWCRYRRRSRKVPIGDTAKIENGEVEHTELKESANGDDPGPSKSSKCNLDSNKDGQKSDGAETTHSQSSGHSKKSKTGYDKIALSRSHLKDIKMIGRGEFGDVMIAKIASTALQDDKRNIVDNTGVTGDKELPVLVKSLSQTKDENCLTEFKREIDMFSKLSHENVSKLYGLCREAESHYMILEYTDWGDLKQFLVATQKEGGGPPLTPIQCVAIIQQIAKGMEHISAARMVHRDLAARNCLITSSLTAKVGLSRLTRDPYSQEYCKHANQIIPLRWLPYEAVYEDEYSTKSDVYSFAVVISEIFNKGELPFPKMNDTSVLNKMKEKSLEWKSHKDTPEAVHKLQETCWDLDPQKRPTFTHLTKEINEILKSM